MDSVSHCTWHCYKQTYLLQCPFTDLYHLEGSGRVQTLGPVVFGTVINKPISCSAQDQDSLLVKCRNDNHSPGPVIRELVPSSHQRSELSNTILCIFSGWDQRIGEGIPIPDSLGEEATFINICIGNGSLKCHRVLISTTPSFGDKVICWYTGFSFKTFI